MVEGTMDDETLGATASTSGSASQTPSTSGASGASGVKRVRRSQPAKKYVSKSDSQDMDLQILNKVSEV